MRGILKKFEKTKEDITVTIKCSLDSNMHNLVDMLDNQVEFGITGQTQIDMTDPVISFIAKQIAAREKVAYEQGMAFAIKQLKEGDFSGADS